METLVIAQARDGSTSLREIIHAYFMLNCQPPNWGYVSNTFELWPAICEQIRTGYSSALYKTFNGWNKKVEVSHGLGFVMPVVRAVFGPKLRILRVVRDRADHIQSLAKRVYIDPEHWLGYSPPSIKRFPAGTIEVPRPTAVDFREETENQWAARTIEQRFEWFVDKQGKLIEEYLPLFDDVMTIHTEELSDLGTIRSIGNFINPGWKVMPLPVHIHKTSNVDVSRYPTAIRKRIEVFWEQFDLDKVIEDPSYAANFLLEDLIYRYQDCPGDLEPVLKDIQSRINSALKARAPKPKATTRNREKKC